MVALHNATESPIGAPVNRSLTRPIGSVHQAGHGSARSSRQLIRIRKPKSGNHPLLDMIGRVQSRVATTTEAAGTAVANCTGPWPIFRLDASAARTIRGRPERPVRRPL